MTAQPVGHEDREVHGSSRGAENGKQSSLPNKSQKRKNGVFLTENQDELNDKCSPLVQPQQAANPDNASTTTKRQRYRFVEGILIHVFHVSVSLSKCIVV